MDCGELSSVVLKVLRPLDDSRTDEYYKYIFFTGDGIASYTGRICVYIKHKTDLECVLPAKKFYEIMPKTGDADFELIKDGRVLTIKTNNTTAKINTVDAPDLIESIGRMKLKKKRNWKPLPEDFMKALNMCYHSASKELNEPAMTCVYIKDNIVAASDEVRISEYRMSEGIGDKEILIPAKTVNELVMYDTLTRYNITGDWIYFTDKKKTRKFCSLLVTADFPDYSENFDFDVLNSLSLPISDTIEAVRYVAPMATEDEHGFSWMQLTAKGKELEFITQDEDFGEASAVVKLRKKIKKKTTIFINPSFLVHIVRDAHSMQIGADRAKFETKEFTHLIALMKEGVVE